MEKIKLKCLIVDDEAMARKLLESYVQQLPFLELAGMCKNPFEAMSELQSQPIDLLLLDIQMPGMLGTRFLQGLLEKPMVIFVTAYDQYAVESYDLDVVDYLMKPVSIERFSKAAHKALEEQQKRLALAQAPVSAPAPVGDFFVHSGYGLVKIPVGDITHIEGMKDYVKIFLENQPKPVLTKSTLKAITDKLPAGDFMRVHKSFIVQMAKISAFKQQQLMLGAHLVPVGDRYLQEVLSFINT